MHNATESLTTWLARAATPDATGCESVTEQAIALLEQACVHLPSLLESGVDPVKRLKLLRSNPPETINDYYRELLSIFAEAGDRHTACFLPEPFADRVAFLPFLVREFFDAGQPRLSVVASAHDELRPGATLVSWNDASLPEVLDRHMTLQLGANPSARRAKAVQTLTLRPLAWLPVPTTEDVVLETIGTDGRRRKLCLPWQVSDAGALAHYFSPLLQEKQENAHHPTENLRARLVETSSGVFGCIRIKTFQEHPDSFLRSFIATLESMPPAGLILDLRGCEEGFVPTAERLLQLFTSETIEPQPFQFRITGLVRRLVNVSSALREWRDPVERAFQRGEDYSEGRPLTSPQEANSIGQRYYGSVVLLVDALTYSSAEMFAAGFQDHGIGSVLGTAPRTGGGGASPWQQSMIFKISEDEAFRPLPNAPMFRVAVRRCQRVRTRSGQPLERVGVTPDALHLPTHRDLFEEDADVYERAGKILAENMKRRYINHP
ncbi:MAG: S41 family peptidase [Pyrinomonadaceae bacterium]